MSKTKIKVSAGGASIDLSGRALDMFNELVDAIAPDTRRALEDYATELEQHAKKNWIVRAKDSKRSIDKFYKVFFVTPDFRISAGGGNSAPYAFAFKVGEKQNRKKNWKVRAKDSKRSIDKFYKVFS